MPALLLVLRIGRMPFPVPFPWFLVWVPLLPFALLGQAAGSVASVFNGKRSTALAALAGSMRIWGLVTCLHGLEVMVRSSEDNLVFRFI